MVDPRIERLRDLGADIAEAVYFGPDVYIEHWFAPLLTIESGAVLSQGVTVLLHDSSLNNVAGDDILLGKVTLRENCYLGANTTVLCDVEVGAGSLVGANSLLTRDIPENCVAFGSPARVVGSVTEFRDRTGKHGTARTAAVSAKPWRHRSSEEHERQLTRVALEEVSER